MRLNWASDALDDLQRIYVFNAERSEAWAMRVEHRLIERAQGLLASPHLGRPTGERGARRLSISDIQYVMDYEIAGDRIRILAVQSTREIH